jgi:hypothetical protein
MEPTKKTNSFLEVILLEPDSDVIHEALGITDERKEELIANLKTLWKEAEKEDDDGIENMITTDFHKLSLMSKHVNEFAYLLFNYSTNIGRKQIVKDLIEQAGANVDVMAILSKIFGK